VATERAGVGPVARSLSRLGRPVAQDDEHGAGHVVVHHREGQATGRGAAYDAVTAGYAGIVCQPLPARMASIASW
jgi:hypothetical protein